MKKLFLLPFVAMFGLVGCGGSDNPGGGGGGGGGKEVVIKFEAGECNAPTGDAGEATVTKEGLTVAFTKVNCKDWSIVQGEDPIKQLRINKSSTVTFSGKAIKKIKFTCQLDYVGTSTSYYGADGFTADSGDITAEPAGARDQVGYWNGDAETLVLTASNHQVRVYSFEVTLK